MEIVTQAAEQAQHQFTLTLPAQPIYLNGVPTAWSFIVRGQKFLNPHECFPN